MQLLAGIELGWSIAMPGYQLKQAYTLHTSLLYLTVNLTVICLKRW